MVKIKKWICLVCRSCVESEERPENHGTVSGDYHILTYKICGRRGASTMFSEEELKNDQYKVKEEVR